MEPTKQSTQTLPIPETQPVSPSPKTNLWMIIAIILLTTLFVGGGMYFWLKPSPAAPTETKQPDVSPSQEPITSPSPSAQTPQKSGLTPINANWNKFTTSVLGFSLNVPKLILEPYAACKYIDTGGDHSYRPAEGPVAVQFFSDTGIVYLASEYTYQLSGETKEGGRTYYSKCDKTPNTIAILADRKNYNSPQWQIVIKTISSDAELEQFLKNRYGEGCKLGDKKPFKQEGVFDIQIEGDGLDLGETKCPINYMTKVLYYPAKKKLAAWDIGQACSFAYPAFENCMDLEMVDSFRFE